MFRLCRGRIIRRTRIWRVFMYFAVRNRSRGGIQINETTTVAHMRGSLHVRKVYYKGGKQEWHFQLRMLPRCARERAAA